MTTLFRRRQDSRAAWIAPWLEGVWRDVRQGIRGLRRNPGMVAVSALSLGLGIGLNAILYMGVSTIYGHEPTMVEPDRMVAVEPGNANQFSYPDYRDLQRSDIFAGVLGFRTSGMNLGTGDRITPVGVLNVTATFFDVLCVGAVRGRTFSAADAAPERDPRVVVVTFDFWRSFLRADQAVIGESLVLNGERFVLVGVLPEGYRAVTGWMAPPLYVPLSRLTLPTLEERGSPSLSVLARLAPGATAAQAQAAVTALGASLERAYPERNQGMGRPASVFPAAALQFRGTPVQFMLLASLTWIIAGLVLLIACLNVMGLLMARAAHQRRETAVRVAVGAGRGRLIQAMLVEGFLVVVAGAAVGLPLAFALNQIPFPGSLAAMQDAMAMDGRLVPFALGLVAVATLVCGLIPAVRATRGDVVAEVLHSGDTATPRLRFRQMLVVGQMAMSLVLLVAALLCIRSQMLIGRVDLGFDLEHGVVARFGLDPSQYPGDERARFAERVVERIAGIPGVSSAAAANLVPLGFDSLVRSFHPAGRTDIPGTRPSTYSVGPDYFRTLGIPILRGRDFDRSQVAGSPVVAIVNETFAKTHFPNTDVVGQRIETADEPEAVVIGVVRDHRIDTIGEAPRSVVYFPYAQRSARLIVHARTATPPDALVTAIRKAIDEIDPTVPVSVQTLRRAASLELTMRRVGTVLIGSIGAVALLLAMVGLYGVMTYVTAARTPEVGIRMALGASARRIRREMLQRAFGLVAAGAAIGAVASAGLMPTLSTFLAGVSPFDPVAFGSAAMLLVLVGLAAAYVPARRSSEIDPIRALRQQ